MRIFLSVLVFFITSNMVLSAPNYDPSLKPIVYDVSDDIALRNKLEDNFYKKYVKKIDDTHYVDTSPLDAYYWEVQVPYDLRKQTNKIISK